MTQMPTKPEIVNRQGTLYLTLPAHYDETLPGLVNYLRSLESEFYIDWVAVKEAYKYSRGRPFPFADKDPSFMTNEKVKVFFDDKDLHAYMMFYPPKPGGGKLDDGEISELLFAYGIIPALVDQKQLRLSRLRTEYGELIPIASGRLPKDGHKGQFLWVETHPADVEGFLEAHKNSLDLPQGIVQRVKEGEVVAQRGAPSPGTPGITVRGVELPQRILPDNMLLGDGLSLTPDGKTVVANQGGQLKVKKGGGVTADVHPLYETSNIQDVHEWMEGGWLPGSLIFNGDFAPNFKVKIAGDLEVRGGMVRAQSDVTGSIFVRDGIIQNRLFPLRCAGLVSASFFERSAVSALAIHVRRYTMNSTLLGARLLTGAGNFMVKGGVSESAKLVQIHELGAMGGVETEAVISNKHSMELASAWLEWSAEISNQMTNTPDPAMRRHLAQEAVRMESLGSKSGFNSLEGKISVDIMHPGVLVHIYGARRKFDVKMMKSNLFCERIGHNERVALERA